MQEARRRGTFRSGASARGSTSSEPLAAPSSLLKRRRQEARRSKPRAAVLCKRIDVVKPLVRLSLVEDALQEVRRRQTLRIAALCKRFDVVKPPAAPLSPLEETLCKRFGVVKPLAAALCKRFGVVKPHAAVLCKRSGVVKPHAAVLCKRFGVVKPHAAGASRFLKRLRLQEVRRRRTSRSSLQEVWRRRTFRSGRFSRRRGRLAALLARGSASVTRLLQRRSRLSSGHPARKETGSLQPEAPFFNTHRHRNQSTDPAASRSKSAAARTVDGMETQRSPSLENGQLRDARVLAALA